MRKHSFLWTLGLAGLGFCGLMAPQTFAQTATCSNATFLGSYGFTVNGVVNLPVAYGGLTSGDPVVLQGVQMIYSDGKGNLTDTESIILNGNPLAGPDGKPLGQPPGYFSVHTGTYKINANCTGTAYLTNGYNFVNLAFVIDMNGQQVRMLVVPPYDSGGVPRTAISVGELVAKEPAFPQ